MTHPQPSNPPFPSLKASLIMMVISIALLALFSGGLLLMGRGDQIAPAAAAMGACLFAAILALEPVRLASRHGLQRVAMAVLVSFVLRLALAVTAVAIVVLGWSLPVLAVILWAMAWYLLLLVIEVTLIYQYFGACAARVMTPPASPVAPVSSGGVLYP